jgi:hypothetical protein
VEVEADRTRGRSCSVSIVYVANQRRDCDGYYPSIRQGWLVHASMEKGRRNAFKSMVEVRLLRHPGAYSE